MNGTVLIVAQVTLVVLTLLLLPCAYRVMAGPSPADRLQAIETSTTLLIGIIVVLALLQGLSMIIDVAIALAAFGLIATLAISRYLSEGRVF